MRKNNKGYTLIEILVVMAILGVVTSASTVSFNMIYNARVTTAARTINSYMKTTRLHNMTKTGLKYIHIFKESGSYYVYIDNDNSIDTSNMEETIGSTSMAMSCIMSGGSRDVVRDGEGITIYFDRTGQCLIYGTSGGYLGNVNGLLFNNSTRESTINISQVTGKTSME